MVLVRRPVSAAALAAGTTIALRRKLHDLPAQETLRLAGLGHLFAGRQVAATITRAWWPVALVLAVVLRRTRSIVLAAATVPPLLDWAAGRTSLGPVRYVALRVADDVAYGAGLWAGVIEHRRIGALTPKFTNWPGRGVG